MLLTTEIILWFFKEEKIDASDIKNLIQLIQRRFNLKAIAGALIKQLIPLGVKEIKSYLLEESLLVRPCDY